MKNYIWVPFALIAAFFLGGVFTQSSNKTEFSKNFLAQVKNPVQSSGNPEPYPITRNPTSPVDPVEPDSPPPYVPHGWDTIFLPYTVHRVDTNTHLTSSGTHSSGTITTDGGGNTHYYSSEVHSAQSSTHENMSMWRGPTYHAANTRDTWDSRPPDYPVHRTDTTITTHPKYPSLPSVPAYHSVDTIYPGYFHRVDSTYTNKQPPPPTPPVAPTTPVNEDQDDVSLIQSNLGIGSSGSSVYFLQEVLRKQGFFKAESTGYFGPITSLALREFQKKYGLTQTGIMDETTQIIINSVQ